MRLLAEKQALVTGAARGNGFAIARAMAAAGANVVLTDVDREAVASAAARLRDEGWNATGHAADVTDLHGCQDLAARIRASSGELDVLVNNAGVLSRESMASAAGLETARRVMEINFFGAMNMVGACLDSLKSARGTIINIASIASFRALPNSVGYAPSKAALAMLTRDLARELAPDGVRVNAIAPGVIETPMTAATMADPARLSSFLSRIPMGRVGQPAELGGPVVFLASDLASYVTGTVLPVDGGYLT